MDGNSKNRFEEVQSMQEFTSDKLKWRNRIHLTQLGYYFDDEERGYSDEEKMVEECGFSLHF